jgi:hypothetical protein
MMTPGRFLARKLIWQQPVYARPLDGTIFNANQVNSSAPPFWRGICISTILQSAESKRNSLLRAISLVECLASTRAGCPALPAAVFP